MTIPPSPSITVRMPRYCKCGRELVARENPTGRVDSFTGEPLLERDLVCPRFPRQWRNLFQGGLKHDGWWGDEHGIVGRYQWM